MSVACLTSVKTEPPSINTSIVCLSYVILSIACVTSVRTEPPNCQNKHCMSSKCNIRANEETSVKTEPLNVRINNACLTSVILEPVERQV